MSKIFITGSSDGIGYLAAKMLVEEGNEVVLHARNKQRAKELQQKFSQPCQILIADFANTEEIKELAKEVNSLGVFDAIIYNAGVYNASNKLIFQVNVLAPFILTSLINKPKRLIYIGSNMHPQGKLDIQNLALEQGVDYATSKLQLLMLALATAKKLSDVYVNIVDPGWIPTKMANYNAPDSLEDGTKTQVWLASNEKIKATGKYFFHLKETSFSSKASDEYLQEELVNRLEYLSGIESY